MQGYKWIRPLLRSCTVAHYQKKHFVEKIEEENNSQKEIR